VHARVSTVEADGPFDEAAIGTMRRDVVPRVLAIPGNLGIIMLHDLQRGRGMSISLWEDEDALRASDQAGAGLRGEATTQTSAQQTGESGVFQVTGFDLTPGLPTSDDPLGEERHASGGTTGWADPRDLVDAFAAALNAKNTDDLGRLFVEDAEFVNIMGMRMRRREGIVEGHAWAFAGPLRGRRVRFDQVDVLTVTDDVTVLHGHCIREREPDAPAEGLPDGSSVLAFVARRGPRGWQIAAATNVTEAAPPRLPV
jgi:uncharacterized protein (TIGR02246 family)